MYLHIVITDNPGRLKKVQRLLESRTKYEKFSTADPKNDRVIFSRGRWLFIGRLNNNRIVDVTPLNIDAIAKLKPNTKIRVIADGMSRVQKASVAKMLSRKAEITKQR